MSSASRRFAGGLARRYIHSPEIGSLRVAPQDVRTTGARAKNAAPSVTMAKAHQDSRQRRHSRLSRMVNSKRPREPFRIPAGARSREWTYREQFKRISVGSLVRTWKPK